MKVVFMGTPEFALPTLDRLASSRHEVLAVVTQPDRPRGRGQEVSPPPVKQLALERGIPVLQPEKASRPEFIEEIRKLNPDLIVVAAYGQILKREFLEIPRIFCVNVHSSLLPKYRGAAPINRAIINGDTESGVTTMKIAEQLDAGDILLMRAVAIGENDTAQTLHDRLAKVGGELALETVNRLEENSILPIPQDESRATYAHKLKKDDGLIRWEQEAVRLHNLVRGLEPWPGAFTFYKGKRLRVCATEIHRGDPADRPGVVARVSDYGIEVGTGKDRLVLTRLHPEGKKHMLAKCFIAGYRIAPGDTLDLPA
ncbi:MAG: methionyl-tRNA formyltransferase [Nitrospinae bacterium CG11_big_fil_rev_8_21_14_0_20_56_8]|nr:MAG: methionyl-tRNA formyltransferase [Nitrospinae bacterium CG11_big_fil_rev_8_21_14_0_20_56_8]